MTYWYSVGIPLLYLLNHNELIFVFVIFIVMVMFDPCVAPVRA